MSWLSNLIRDIKFRYQKASNIFYCDKSKWFHIDTNGRQDWSKSSDKVKEFWRKVREEKMVQKDYNFSQFVFPPVLDDNETFWFKEKARKFDGNADFINAKFVGEVDFSHTQFVGEADFRSAQFLDTTYFIATQFSDTAYFSESQFSGYTFFIDAQFSEVAYFRNAQFKNRLELKAAHFTNELNLTNAQISFAKSLDTEGYNLKETILEECNLYGIQELKNVNFEASFLLSLNLSSKTLINCNLTGAMTFGLVAKGWKPDEATIQNTKYIYTDYEIKNELDPETSKPRKTYHVKEESRVPATGEFRVGENEGFTIKEFFKDPIKWSYGLNLPKEIRTGFLNYIKFFEDYLLTTENIEIEIRTKREGHKVRVEFAADDLEKKTFVTEKFGEYMENITKDPSNLHIDFSRSKAKSIDQELLEVKYENRLRDIQTELNFTRRLLLKEEKSNQQLLEVINHISKEPKLVMLPTPKEAVNIPETDTEKLHCDELKSLVDSHPLQVIQQLKNLSLPSHYQDDLAMLGSQFNQYKTYKKDNTVGHEQLDQKYSKCITNLLSLLNDLRDDEILA